MFSFLKNDNDEDDMLAPLLCRCRLPHGAPGCGNPLLRGLCTAPLTSLLYQTIFHNLFMYCVALYWREKMKNVIKGIFQDSFIKLCCVVLCCILYWIYCQSPSCDIAQPNNGKQHRNQWRRRKRGKVLLYTVSGKRHCLKRQDEELVSLIFTLKQIHQYHR